MVNKSNMKEEEQKQQSESEKQQEKASENTADQDTKQAKTSEKKPEEKLEDKKAQPGKEHEKKGKKSSSKKEKKKDPKDEKIQELGEQVDKLNDRYVRLQAEFDNYRKRTIKERADLLKTAGEDVLKDMLPVVDDIDRAVDTINEAEDIEAIKSGIQLIDQKFKEFIKQKGVEEIEALHQEFDTDLHEAMTKIPAQEEELKGKVVDVIQKGYKLNDKVIRFAKVVIGE